MSLARMAKSVLKARSDFSTAVMTPLTLSVLPVMASSTARVASSCNFETSSMLLRSVSEKLAPPVSPGDAAAFPATLPMPPTLPRLLTPLIIVGSASADAGLRQQPERRVQHRFTYFHRGDVRFIRSRRLERVHVFHGQIDI